MNNNGVSCVAFEAGTWCQFCGVRGINVKLAMISQRQKYDMCQRYLSRRRNVMLAVLIQKKKKNLCCQICKDTKIRAVLYKEASSVSCVVLAAGMWRQVCTKVLKEQDGCHSVGLEAVEWCYNQVFQCYRNKRLYSTLLGENYVLV